MLIVRIALVTLALTIPLQLSAGVEAVTKPSGDVTMAFINAGKVGEIAVKEGDTVKQGQLLVKLDDMAESLQVEQLKAEADDETRVLAAQAQLDQKKEDVIKLKQAESKLWDIVHAELDVKIAELSLKLAMLEHDQAGRKYREAAAHVDRMRMLSPISGKVEELFLEVGEAADERAKVVRVVQIDPLRIDVACPRPTAEKLLLGSTAKVEFGSGQVADGRVSFIAAVADSASNTITVRVDVPNPSGRPAGEHVMVEFESETATSK